MHTSGLASLLVVACCAFGVGSLSAARQSSAADRYMGTWTGTWDGSGTGAFEMTLEKDGSGAPGGRVAVKTDGGDYTADLRAMTFDGPKMTAKYDFPLDPSAEVAVAASFEDRSAKGTWSLRPKGQGQDAEIAGGTWTVAKK
jgi:hypothetical protein